MQIGLDCELAYSPWNCRMHGTHPQSSTLNIQDEIQARSTQSHKLSNPHCQPPHENPDIGLSAQQKRELGALLRHCVLSIPQSSQAAGDCFAEVRLQPLDVDQISAFR